MSPAVSGTQLDIAAIKLNYPLLDVVQRLGVVLKRSGSHRWQAHCPFHDDRTPSFFVDVERQRFVCFGCKARGDVIDFERLHQRVTTLSEACAWLTGPTPPAATRRDTPSPGSGRAVQRWDRLTL